MGGFFQVQLIVDRKHEDVILTRRTYRDERFKHDFMCKSELICRVLCVGEFVALIRIGVIGNFHAVQDPHCICF